MSKYKKNGFTLVELLAVIVILAIILVIAVPQIMNVITESRKGTLISSAKLIAKTAETKKLSNDLLGIDKVLTCSDVAKINDEDYESCIVSFDENGKAQVTIVGKGKLEGMSVCGATKESSELSNECITDAACFSYEETQQVSSFDINKEACKTFFVGLGVPIDEVETVCTGGEIDGYTLKGDINDAIQDGSEEAMSWINELETEGVISIQYVDGISITGYSYACPKNVIIPGKIDNKEVIAIGGAVFEYRDITSVVIPNSVTTIGNSVFYGNQLTSVTIPNSVTTIGSEAFMYNQLTSVTIPNSVTTIGSEAFMYNQLTSVTIPNSVTTIGELAFNNNNLKDVDAFIYKRNSDGTIDNTYIMSYGGTAKDIIIPNGVTTIGRSLFSSNQLTNVVIPNSVTTIGDFAFNGNQLTSVTIPNSVTTIGRGAFQKNQLTSVTIPNSVTSIGDYAFQYNSLTSVTIPNSVTTIGKRAFEQNQLTSVTIPNSVTTIGSEAFHKELYSNPKSNPNLTSIVNTTGRSFDWNGIITGTSGTSSITGTYNGVNVTTK